jgi:predicted dehydrogenase
MKAAIIGLGPMGLRHAASVARVSGLELAAVCDTRKEALEKAALGPGVRRFEDAGRLLTESLPDLLIIATTAPSHHNLTLAALDAGVRRLLVEKPLACSLAQAKEMLEEGQRCGARIAVNHCRRHVAGYAWLAKEIRSGRWGTMRGIFASCPGIGLGCLATHFLDLMRFLGGEDFVTVSGWVDPERKSNPRGADFHDPGGLIVATGASGVRYVHHQIEDSSGPFSLVLDLTQARVTVEEDEGRLSVMRRDPSVTPGPDRPARFEVLEPPAESPLKLDILEMCAAVLTELAGDGPLTCDARHGYQSLEAVVATHVSHRRGHIPLSLPLEEMEILTEELPIT